MFLTLDSRLKNFKIFSIRWIQKQLCRVLCFSNILLNVLETFLTLRVTFVSFYLENFNKYKKNQKIQLKNCCCKFPNQLILIKANFFMQYLKHLFIKIFIHKFQPFFFKNYLMRKFRKWNKICVIFINFVSISANLFYFNCDDTASIVHKVKNI